MDMRQMREKFKAIKTTICGIFPMGLIGDLFQCDGFIPILDMMEPSEFGRLLKMSDEDIGILCESCEFLDTNDDGFCDFIDDQNLTGFFVEASVSLQEWSERDEKGFAIIPKNWHYSKWCHGKVYVYEETLEASLDKVYELAKVRFLKGQYKKPKKD